MNRTRLLVSLAGLAMLLALAAVACSESGKSEVEPTQGDAPAATEKPTAGEGTAPTDTAPAPPPVAAPVPLAERPSAEAAEAAAPARTGRTGAEDFAPELQGISGWINSEPFTLASLREKVVLIDFWTYTCINCIRTFPYLRDWHEKYADKGLVIVGVHTPEFEFEKDRGNVIEAAAKHGLEYAIVQDNNRGTWDAFRNRFWPAKYLIDKDGFIRYTHFGEGAYEETEVRIRELLAETGTSVNEIAVNVEPDREMDPRARGEDFFTSFTRELYAGYERNYGALTSGSRPPYVLHEEYYQDPDVTVLYEDPGEHRNQFIYLEGLWHNGPESLRHARMTEGYEDYIAIKFRAASVNAVMIPAGGEPFEVRLTIDDMPIPASEAGADVRFDEDGNSYILVDRSEMYRLVENSDFSGRELKLSSNSEHFSLFAFTFGAFAESPGL